MNLRTTHQDVPVERLRLAYETLDRFEIHGRMGPSRKIARIKRSDVGGRGRPFLIYTVTVSRQLEVKAPQGFVGCLKIENNMCQRLMTRIVHRCHHVIDSLGDIVEYQDCGNCGTVVKTSYLGQTTKRDPCPDCIARGAWVKVQGQWQRV
ncbi:predicted protein [Histoplasma capsulatum H143]|uniref:Uncharacterized protein n=1 Tax=Ajellomyces capsulatus (strain H143) TaxID=544712 RepID=C6HPG0_AJECH|nr:predicted protein [Histoplasma capsulatum H143]